MAVPEQTPYKEYTANGSTTSFALKFQCESKDHLIVLIDDIEPPIATWSLTGGNVVFTTAPAAGKKITLQRNTPFSRTTDYQSYNNSFRPPAVNKDFDWIWLKLQELGVADWILSNRIDALKNYVDDQDDELRAYLMEEIRKQGVALDQLDEYYNYLMERLAQIAVDKGWDASFVVYNGKTLQEFNDRISKQRFSVKAYGATGSVVGAEVDDGDAIIAAIQACSDAGGGEVFFDPLPSGMYYASTLRSQLTNINNVKINGNKQKLYTINPEITAKGSRSPFYINTGDNLEVFGFYFDGRYEDYVSKSKRINSHNFAGEHLSNVKIYHNVFASCGYPNDTTDEAGDSIYIIRNSHDIDIFENIFINPARWSVSFQYNTADLGGIKIRNNFQYITRPNKSLGFIDLEFSSSALATQVSDILIEDNTAYFSGYIAMSNASFKDVTIRNNKLKGYTYGANRVYKSTDYPYGFGMLIQPDAGRLPLENIEILDNTFDSVNKNNIEITFQSKNMVISGNKIYTQPDAPATCGFSKGIAISTAIDVEVSGNSILGTANQASVISLSVTNSTGSVHDNVAKHAVATSPTSFSAAASGELCVYDNYLETQNPTFQFSIGGDGVLFWGNTTPTGTSGRISSGAVVKFYGKNNTKLNADYNSQIINKFFAGQGDLSIAYASSAPVTGTWKVGDIVYNTTPSNGGVLGWSCVNASGSGTWIPFGVLGVQKLTTANLQSATHAANTTNKFAGKSVINSTDKKLYYADGSAPTDVWLSVDGATTINPVA
ncbi:hypothetical protein [Acinetobacter lwoffii]|uniref:hypothetical protein n=1 Tax=Acinetobacter lwoffii TaxID=28090 RepID=UPI003F917C6A